MFKIYITVYLYFYFNNATPFYQRRVLHCNMSPKIPLTLQFKTLQQEPQFLSITFYFSLAKYIWIFISCNKMSAPAGGCVRRDKQCTYCCHVFGAIRYWLQKCKLRPLSRCVCAFPCEDSFNTVSSWFRLMPNVVPWHFREWWRASLVWSLLSRCFFVVREVRFVQRRDEFEPSCNSASGHDESSQRHLSKSKAKWSKTVDNWCRKKKSKERQPEIWKRRLN